MWRFASGKLRRSYDESAEAAAELQRHGGEALRLEPIDFGRRLAVEKELVADEEVCYSPQPSHFVVYVIFYTLYVELHGGSSGMRLVSLGVRFVYMFSE